jgi:hypothetical protein
VQFDRAIRHLAALSGRCVAAASGRRIPAGVDRARAYRVYATAAKLSVQSFHCADRAKLVLYSTCGEKCVLYATFEHLYFVTRG